MIEEMYDQTLQNMEKSHRVLAGRVPPPQAVVHGPGYVYRYQERNIHQALVQKLARVVSGLHAARLLLAHGFLQELGALKRMLDEFNEDISFLACSVVFNDITDLHRDYLKAFFEEELDNPHSAIHSTQKRPIVPRRKIRAYLAAKESGFDPSRGAEVRRTVDKMFSGFVHGASPHIMDMYNGDPPQFCLRGMLGTIHVDAHRENLWSSFYRSIGSFVVTAKAFGDESLVQNVLMYMRNFAKANGQDFTTPPDWPSPQGPKPRGV